MSKRPDASFYGPLEHLMPADPLMAIAWYGSIHWAIGTEEIVQAFREETGCNWKPSRIPIERMIDEATGADFQFIEAFARWHNENIWGIENGKPVDAPRGVEHGR